MKTQPRQHISNKYNTCAIVTSPVYNWSKLMFKKNVLIFLKDNAAVLKVIYWTIAFLKQISDTWRNKGNMSI